MSDVSSTVPATASKNGLSRRQLVKAGVWAAPAVALAAAAPAAAVSVSAVSLTGSQQTGTAARNWNVALKVEGTTSTKSWAVTTTTSGSAVAISGIPAAISADGTYNGVVTLTNWSSSASVSFTLQNGSKSFTTNTILVSAPVAPVTTTAPTATAGSGNSYTVSATATSAGPVSVTAVATWLRATGNGNDGNAGWSTGVKTDSRTIVQDVTSAGTPFTFPSFTKHSSSSTYTITIKFSYTVGGAAIGEQKITF